MRKVEESLLKKWAELKFHSKIFEEKSNSFNLNSRLKCAILDLFLIKL